MFVFLYELDAEGLFSSFKDTGGNATVSEHFRLTF
jgi:hypothetical protein